MASKCCRSASTPNLGAAWQQEAATEPCMPCSAILVCVQVSSTHKLGARWQGEAAAIMGVGTIAGVSLAITHQAERYQASAKIEVCT